jgi:hypothetical protein
MLCNLCANNNGLKYLLQLYCTLSKSFSSQVWQFSLSHFNYLSSRQLVLAQLSLNSH